MEVISEAIAKTGDLFPNLLKTMEKIDNQIFIRVQDDMVRIVSVSPERTHLCCLDVKTNYKGETTDFISTVDSFKNNEMNISKVDNFDLKTKYLFAKRGLNFVNDLTQKSSLYARAEMRPEQLRDMLRLFSEEDLITIFLYDGYLEVENRGLEAWIVPDYFMWYKIQVDTTIPKDVQRNVTVRCGNLSPIKHVIKSVRRGYEINRCRMVIFFDPPVLMLKLYNEYINDFGITYLVGGYVIE